MGKTVNKIKKYCIDNDLIFEKMSIVVAISGGADSVCLLYALNELKVEFDISIFAVHVEHGIRGEEAIEDMTFVEGLCEELCIPLDLYRFDVPGIAKEMGIGIEEAGRIVRYEAFEKSRSKFHADCIAVAHHMNDLAETVVFNMIRGSGLKGLSGIAAKRDKIIRPLLSVTREEIEEYLTRNHIAYRTDSTNLSNDYSRNMIRNSVVPMLNEIVNNSTVHIANAAHEIDEANAYFENMAIKELTSNSKEEIRNGKSVYGIKVSRLLAVDAIIARYMIRLALTKYAGGLKDIDSVHIKNIVDLSHGTCGRKIDLPYGICAIREKDYVLIGIKSAFENDDEFFDITLSLEDKCTFIKGGKLLLELLENEFVSDVPKEIYTKWFDYDKIKNGLHLRNQMQGDYLVVDDKGNRKKLSRYFIDEKVSKSLRSSIPLLADGNHIIWIIGGRISEYYKITSETRRAVKVTFIENN